MSDLRAESGFVILGAQKVIPTGLEQAGVIIELGCASLWFPPIRCSIFVCWADVL